MLSSLAALSVVPIQDEHTAIAPDVPPVKARSLVPQQEAQPPTLWDVPFFDEERAYYKASTGDLDLEHPVLDHLVSLHTHLNIFMWGDSTIAHQFFLLRGLTGGVPSETPPLYNATVPWPAQNNTVCPEVNVHVHKTIYGNASIHLTAAVCKTGAISVAMAPGVLQELHEQHGLSLPQNYGLSLLYIGGSGLHHLHLEDGLDHERDQDWESKKPLEEAFEENLKYGLAKLQARYPDAGLAYLNTHSICNEKLWDLHSVRAVACDSNDLKECFSEVDVPSEEHDWYRETLFSHHGSGVIAQREIAVLEDPSLKWTLVNSRKITKDASCNQTEDGMHYLEPTMMKEIEAALAVLGEGSAVASMKAADHTDEGHHPLKKMRKRVLAHEKKMKLEKAQDKMRKVEQARKKNAGKQGEGDHKRKLKKKIKAMAKMKNARARKVGATQTHDAEQEESRDYEHARSDDRQRDDRRQYYSDEALANGTVDDLYMLHIPKTAVTSFVSDCPAHIGCSVRWDGRLVAADSAVSGSGFSRHQRLVKVSSSEKCFGRGDELGLPVGTFLREPRAHVVSQYYHCRLSEDHAYARSLVPDTIDEWVAAWAQSTPADRAALAAAPVCVQEGVPKLYCCYTPWDLQAQRLTCAQPLEAEWTGGARINDSSTWATDGSKLSPELNGTLALANARRARFVGLVEAYQESVCLFAATTAGVEALPAFCDCEDEGAWGQFASVDNTHGNYTHPPPEALPAEVLERIDAMTANDRLVYAAMVVRFVEDVESVEHASGRRILCETTRKQLGQYSQSQGVGQPLDKHVHAVRLE